MKGKNTIDLNEYEIVKTIGNGGTAVVYKIKEKKSNQFFAAKVYYKPFENNTKDENLNLQREINLMKKLNHPAIIKYEGFSPINFENENKPTIISEFMPNCLYNLLELERCARAPHKWNDTAKLITIYGIASAMKYLHSQNVIHHDLKTLNILVDNDLKPKITDFGLAKILNCIINGLNMNSTPNVKGTVYCIAPEVWENIDYTPACDVYAFAYIVFEITTGQIPFEGLKPEQIIFKVMNHYRPPFKTNIPKSYKKLIEKCWAHDQNDRPTFEQILQQLKEDPSFITDSIDEDEYKDYIESIENSEYSLINSHSLILIDDFVQSHSKLEISSKSTDFPKDIPIKLEDIDAESLFNKAQNMIDDIKSSDKSECVYCYKLAAEKGHLAAMFQYGVILYQGILVESDKKESAKYFKMVADKGYSRAMLMYGVMLRSGIGVNINKKEAAHYIKSAADKGLIDAINLYADMLKNGEGIIKNIIEAAKYYKLAADKGDVDSMYQYALLLDDDKEPSNKREAAKYYKLSADNGKIDAMYKYALFLNKGIGVSSNKQEMVKYFKMAADNGHINAMFCYGLALLYGEGIGINKKEAAQYFKRAADLGNESSMIEYALLLLNGDCIPKNQKESVVYLKSAVDLGNAEAMFYYAWILYKGEIVQSNKKMAAGYYKLAADKGHVESMKNYAIMLSEGDGIEKNLKDAAYYIKCAADKGDVDSMVRYAGIKLCGIGVPENYYESVRYFKRAADMGNADGMYFYSIHLSCGKGVPANQKMANMYLKLAANKGQQNAIEKLNNQKCIIS